MGHDRQAALETIRSNIAKHGQHVYLILGGAIPSFAYTIGLHPHVGVELIFAGGAFYSRNQIVDVLNETAVALRAGGVARAADSLPTTHGHFALRRAHASWADRLLLGALDYHSLKQVEAIQVVPPDEGRTIDVADLSRPFDPDIEPVWRCLTEPWPYAMSKDSTVVTNLEAMRGEPVTEGLRRKEGAWELFAGADPDVPQNGVFIVPLAMLVAFDPSLLPFTTLPVGAGLRRERNGPWKPRHSNG